MVQGGLCCAGFGERLMSLRYLVLVARVMLMIRMAAVGGLFHHLGLMPFVQVSGSLFTGRSRRSFLRRLIVAGVMLMLVVHGFSSLLLLPPGPLVYAIYCPRNLQEIK
jgi:hypothetical protein